MASPQLEDGYTRLANELIEQLFKRRFGARDQAVLRFVERYTYGYQTKACAYSTRAIADATGIAQAHVRATVLKLVSKNVLTLVDNLLSIQKDHDRWLVPLRTPDGEVDGETIQNGSESHRIGAHQNGSLAHQNGAKTIRNGSKAIQSGAHQNGSETHQFGAHQDGAPIQNGSQERTETDRSGDSNASNGADVETPKEKRKVGEKIDRSNQRLPGEDYSVDLDVRKRAFEEADLALLSEACHGQLFTPVEFAHHIGKLIAGLVREGKAASGAATAYHEMPPARMARWVKVSMDLARDKARNKSGWAKYAAAVIVGALESNTDLVSEIDEARATPDNVLVFPAPSTTAPAESPYAAKPWGYLWGGALQGTTCDREYLERQAQRAYDKGGKTCDVQRAVDIFRADGVIPAMDYVWSCYARNQARGAHAAC